MLKTVREREREISMRGERVSKRKSERTVREKEGGSERERGRREGE